MKHLFIIFILLIGNHKTLAQQNNLTFIQAERGPIYKKYEEYISSLEIRLSDICTASNSSRTSRQNTLFTAEQWNLQNDKSHKYYLLKHFNLTYAIEIRTKLVASSLEVSLFLNKINGTTLESVLIGGIILNKSNNESDDNFLKWLTGLNEEIRLAIDGKLKEKLYVVKFRHHKDMDPGDVQDYEVNIPKALVVKFTELNFTDFKIEYCDKSEDTWRVVGKITSVNANSITIDVEVWGSNATQIYRDHNREFPLQPSYDTSAKNLARIITNRIKAKLSVN